MIARRVPIAFVLIALFFAKNSLRSQETSHSGEREFYAGYGFLSSSFNAYASFSGTPMNGWDAALTIRARRSLSISFEALGLYGTNLGASQIEHTFSSNSQGAANLGAVGESITKPIRKCDDSWLSKASNSRNWLPPDSN